MTPFEKGYAAFLRGDSTDLNPFDGETEPYSRKRWGEGWAKAQGDKRARV